MRYNGRELTANNVLLLGVQQVSQGSLQPELGIVSTLHGVVVNGRPPAP